MSKFSDALQKLVAIQTIVATLTPTLVQTVAVVEGVLPGSPGVDKFNAAFGHALEQFGRINQTLVAFETVAPMVADQINGIVALLNATGVFRKKGAEPTGDPAHT